mgnify:CR=1 FL=1
MINSLIHSLNNELISFQNHKIELQQLLHKQIASYLNWQETFIKPFTKIFSPLKYFFFFLTFFFSTNNFFFFFKYKTQHDNLDESREMDENEELNETIEEEESNDQEPLKDEETQSIKRDDSAVSFNYL